MKLEPSSKVSRHFFERGGVGWIVLAVLSLVALLLIFITKLNVLAMQKYTILALSVVALWQLIRKRNIDLVSLLILALGLFALLSLNKAETLSIVPLMVAAGVMAAVLTLWQGHARFPQNLLMRHAYIVGLVCAEAVAFLAYWIAFDDLLAKAMLVTVMVYVLWGMIELSFRRELTLRASGSYLAVALLLASLVLATMKVIPVITIH